MENPSSSMGSNAVNNGTLSVIRHTRSAAALQDQPETSFVLLYMLTSLTEASFLAMNLTSLDPALSVAPEKRSREESENWSDVQKHVTDMFWKSCVIAGGKFCVTSVNIARNRHCLRRFRRNATTWATASVQTSRSDPAATGNPTARGRRHRRSLRSQHRPLPSGAGGCCIASGRTTSGDAGSEAGSKMAAPVIRLPTPNERRAEDDDAAWELADLEEEDWELDEAACGQPGTSQMPPIPEVLALREDERYVVIDEDEWESCAKSPSPPAWTSGAGGNVAE
uniref:Uncharacterized protein n=1 Tax=Globodera rostochiensis TaxID=31243 RepID=A0A914HNY7_GLORO